MKLHLEEKIVGNRSSCALGRKGRELQEGRISIEEGRGLPLEISPGRGKKLERGPDPAKKTKKINETIRKLANIFEGTSPRPNLNPFTNLFACKDRAAPDRSVGSERRTVIGQPMGDERGRRAVDQPGWAIGTQPR